MLELVELLDGMGLAHFAVNWSLVGRADDGSGTAPATNHNLELLIIVTGCWRKGNMNVISKIDVNEKGLKLIGLISQKLIVIIGI